MALTKKDQEFIAQMVASTVAAMLPNLGGAQAPSSSAPATPAVELPADAEDEEAARETIRQNVAKIDTLNVMVDDIIPHLMQQRHVEVFEWLAKGRGISRGELFRQIIRAEISRVTPLFRDAKGGGGGTTKNPETIAELRRLREENPN